MYNKDALVDAVIPAYNVEKYISDALESLLSQTIKEINIIIVDDCSTDNTASIVRSYKDPRITLLHHEVNSGLSASRNTAINHGSAKYVSFLDGDDIAMPTRIEEQINMLEGNSQIGMVGSHVAVINEDGSPRNLIWKRPVTFDDSDIRMLFRNTFSAVMTVRRSDIPDGGFRAIPMAEDYDFNSRLAAKTKVINIDKPLTKVRVRGSGLTLSNVGLMDKHVKEVMRDQLEILGIHPTEREVAINRHIGSCNLENSSELLCEVEDWLLRLKEANNNVRRYDVKAFERVIADEWLNVCTFAAPLGIYAFIKCLVSPLNKHYSLRVFFRYSKLLLKSIMRKGRSGGDVPSA